MSGGEQQTNTETSFESGEIGQASTGSGKSKNTTRGAEILKNIVKKKILDLADKSKSQ